VVLAFGQLGVDSGGLPKTRPVLVPLAEPAVGIGAGGEHTCIVGKSGRAYCVGEGGAGELGTGSFQSKSSPAPVVLPCDDSIRP
jgi:alpha-tubulin suppressor-like RCC1 family protein